MVRDLYDGVLDPVNVPGARVLAIASGLLLSIAASIGFMIAFAKQMSTQWQGFTLCVVFVGFLIAALGWSKWILEREEVVDLRDEYPSPSEDRAQSVDLYGRGIAQLTRRRWLTRIAYAAFGLFGLAALFPLGALGPEPDGKLFHTRWKRGVRVQRADGSLVRVDDLNVDGIVTVFPEHSIGDAQSMAVLIRLPEGVGQNAVRGLIAYSKTCTHAGCPVALYRAADRRLVCPCHQSAFDVADNASVLSGPADRPLPRLPLAISGDYVIADGDFSDAVGPGSWQHA